MFGKSYIKYEVTTEPFKWTVERRYSDFDALRKLLQKYYPSFYVPPLPLKKIGNKRFTESFINKRMKFLNQFINNVIASESFKCAEFLYAFLSYTDRGKFESKFKEYQTRTPSPYVEEYKTLDGIISISLDEKNERYFKNTNKYFNLQANILEKVNYNLKTLNHNMKIVCELVKVIQKNFEVLHVLNTRVMMKPTITKAYEEISCFFKNWGNILTKQRLLIKDHIKDFFKYINLEGHAYSELIVRREELKDKYNSENARITAKKEKLFTAGDINKMELNLDDKSIDKQRILKDKPYAFDHICLADTRELEKLNNQLGYANKMNMRELRKIIKEYCIRFVDNLAAFDQGFYPSINDMLNTWTNLENFVQTANAGIKR
jgi:sorting nexin-7/30/sorting nexin-8